VSRINYLYFSLFIAFPLIVNAADDLDLLVRSPDLTLTTLLDQVLENYPDYEQIQPRLEEARQLGKRADSLLAGGTKALVRYQTGEIGNNDNLREYEAGLELPLWRFGQRRASHDVAEEAHREAERFSRAVRWQVAGAIRTALWRIQLTESLHEEAHEAHETSTELMNTVRRRVELGDLAPGDLLQAEQDVLSNKIRVLSAESAYVDAAHAYEILTESSRLPTSFLEQPSQKNRIDENHPMLALSFARLNRSQAEYELAQQARSDSPLLFLGARSERGGDDNEFEDSVGLIFSYPLGSANLKAEMASSQVRVAAARGEHKSIRRMLETQFHDAKHDLEHVKREREAAMARNELASQHLEMSRIAFELGDIELMIFLRVKETAFTAKTLAREKEILWQNAIANYNQAVGEIP